LSFPTPTEPHNHATAAAPASASAVRTIIWPLLRIALAFVFLWAFLDKTFALGFATGRDPETGEVAILGSAAWINGGSPTSGFLEFGTSGPLASSFSSLAGNPVIDWLFMLGMGGVGIALLLGIGMRIAAAAGVAIMLLMRLAIWQSENNPVVDDHLIYALLLIALAVQPEALRGSLAAAWRCLPLVERFPILR
jgi:thiosulfate dehydrogenase [quinone] large subunit